MLNAMHSMVERLTPLERTSGSLPKAERDYYPQRLSIRGQLRHRMPAPASHVRFDSRSSSALVGRENTRCRVLKVGNLFEGISDDLLLSYGK
jgi:hypothetical protein